MDIAVYSMYPSRVLGVSRREVPAKSTDGVKIC
jgi:hypothetical protein